jgi:DNA (cytosine-5)-methyltransferase 1
MIRNESKKNLQVISLFTGAMGFDLGLEEAGLRIAVCVEYDHQCCESIRLNRPAVPVLESDIRALTTSEILSAAKLRVGQAFSVVGGPPCQSFSTGGKRHSIVDPRGSLFMEFIRIVREAKPKCFVFENVAQLITAALNHRPIVQRPGRRWNLSSYSKDANTSHKNLFEDDVPSLRPDELSGTAIEAVLDEFDKLGYHLALGILNAADYGAAQVRRRLIIVGSRLDSEFHFPLPTHGADPGPGQKPWRNLREVLEGLAEAKRLHSEYTKRFRKYFELIPPGGNWRNLPSEVQKEALGNAFESGGGKTGFFRRLSWNQPAPTIVGKPNRKSSAICHPEEIRPLTIRECARIQGFDDSWHFSGSMHQQYLQVGNAVPVPLGFVIGRALLEAEDNAGGRIAVGTRKKGLMRLWHERRRKMVEEAKQILRYAARNKKVLLQSEEIRRPATLSLSFPDPAYRS